MSPTDLPAEFHRERLISPFPCRTPPRVSLSHRRSTAPEPRRGVVVGLRSRSRNLRASLGSHRDGDLTWHASLRVRRVAVQLAQPVTTVRQMWRYLALSIDVRPDNLPPIRSA